MKSFIQETTQTGLAEYKGSWGVTQITHLLKRTMFGATPDDVTYFSKTSLTKAVDELLAVQADPEPPLNYYQSIYADPTGIALGSTWVNAIYGDGTVNAYRKASLKAWLIGLQINQKRTITEKLVVFWHNHFSTQLQDYDDARSGYIHFSTIRRYALGNFKSFVKAITLDPAMLIYLNGYKSTKSAPDENYGRELQELFTMGKGVNSKYTEDDVKTAAKVLTGMRLKDKTAFVFDSTQHDTTDKKFSAFYNNTTIKGRTGADGINELDDLLTMLFSVDELSKFICRKLYRFFVYYVIDDSIEANVITPLAKIFRDNNFEIKPVLATLFKSEHFFDSQNIGSVIKTPLDLVIGHLREFSVVLPATTDYLLLYQYWNAFVAYAQTMQQDMGDPPNVAGWPAYYQEPLFHELWINTDTLPKRNQYTDSMLAGITRNSFKVTSDPLVFTNKLPNPEDPNKLMKDSLAILYKIDIAQEVFDQIKKDILLSGQTTDSYWTDAWNAYKANPTDKTAMNIVTTRLKNYYKYIMDLPEYQLS